MTSSLPIVAMLDVFTNPDIEQAVLKGREDSLYLVSECRSPGSQMSQ